MSVDVAEERVWRLVHAARRLADSRTVLGKLARARLVGATGLSPENVEACLTKCLETEPRVEDVRRLCEASAPAPRVHIALASTVFVGALRALCLGVASSQCVFVRPSRREPEMVELLRLALAEDASGTTDSLFSVVEKLTPKLGDHVHAYGGSEALSAIASTLPPGVVFYGHGPGFGVAVLDLAAGPDDAKMDRPQARQRRPPPNVPFADAGGTEGAQNADLAQPELERIAAKLAWDTALFDQRGCLSPRLVFVRADVQTAERFAETLANALTALDVTLPAGAMTRGELAERTRYLQTMTYACRVFPSNQAAQGGAERADSAAPGSRRSAVSFDEGGDVVLLPPPARLLHVVRSQSILEALQSLRRSITSVGCFGSDTLHREVSAALPSARITDIGRMQAPSLDGPVDRRTAPTIV